MKNNTNLKAVFRSPFLTLVRNILLAYICFMLCRGVFLWYNWEEITANLDKAMIWPMVKGSLLYDTSGLMYLTSPYIVMMLLPLHIKEKPGYYRAARIVFIVLVLAGCLANIADTVYFPYTGCRSTFNILTEFQNEGTDELGRIFWQNIIDNWFMSLFFIALAAILILFTATPEIIRFNRLSGYYAVRCLTFLLGGFLCVVGIRGGATASIRPIAMSNAFQYAPTPPQAAMILNTPFCAIRSIGHSSKKTVSYFSEDELDGIYNPIIIPDSTDVSRRKNIVVMILESFGAEYVGQLNEGVSDIHDCTPFLDSLMRESMYFEYALANGRKSIDAMPSALSGIPMLYEHFILGPAMMAKEVSGIARELQNEGYYTAFFHGADNRSMGFQSFTNATGFQDYFGMDEFLEQPQYGGKGVFDGVWAIWDEEFLQFMCDRIGSFKEPFVSGVFTATSHNPFNIPERYREQFPEEGNLPIYRTVRYSDHALRRFFENASKQPWFQNTLFVITADHTNLSEHPDYQSAYGKYHIPILIYDPTGEIKGHRNCVAQQSDIPATVLGYLGYDRPFLCFGQNLLTTPDDEIWAADYVNGVYTFYQGDLMIQFDGTNLLGVYEFKSDVRLSENVMGRYPEKEKMMTLKLKAIIQQYLDYMSRDDRPLIMK
ncbi:MAG: LTA synthase family protein [Bacteroidaceae bacterium]|nr:LTA synthase family protein [Bacteroidaceae bacterium]